jgi:hypothetical protein
VWTHLLLLYGVHVLELLAEVIRILMQGVSAVVVRAG